ncbi:MAG: hypothetical protein LBL66_06200 [Clostridiales bacterium]|nr:hypothetical protein [Clostridiales bacterium]
MIRTIGGGASLVVSADAAGNVWTATFTAARTEILSDTDKQYFETADAMGKAYSFATYETAFAYASARETALV